MENLIDYEFTPQIKYYFKYEVEVKTSKEKIIQVILLDTHIEEKDNKKELIIEENEKVKLTNEENKVGYYLRDLLNMYQYGLDKILISYRKLLEKSFNIDRLENGEILSINLLRRLKDDLEKVVPNYSPIISPEIINCLWYMEYHIPKYIGLLRSQIEKINSVKNFDSSCKDRINQLQEQINILESKEFFDKQCLNCINKIIQDMNSVVDTVNNAFYTPKRTKIFKGIDLNIPNHEVKYATATKHPRPNKYLFKFYNLKELMSISIYMFDKVEPLRVVDICKNCGDYFIPNTNSIHYCNKIIKVNKDGKNITCKDIGEEKKFGNKVIDEKKDNTNSNLYHRIYNRLNGEEAQDEFINGYNAIYNKYKNDKERLEIEQSKYLLESNKKYRKINKRGRPYKDE